MILDIEIWEIRKTGFGRGPLSDVEIGYSLCFPGLPKNKRLFRSGWLSCEEVLEHLNPERILKTLAEDFPEHVEKFLSTEGIRIGGELYYRHELRSLDEKRRLREAMSSNKFVSIEEIAPGDRIYDIGTDQYALVLRRLVTSVEARTEKDCRVQILPLATLYRKSPDDVRKELHFDPEILEMDIQYASERGLEKEHVVAKSAAEQHQTSFTALESGIEPVRIAKKRYTDSPQSLFEEFRRRSPERSRCFNDSFERFVLATIGLPWEICSPTDKSNVEKRLRSFFRLSETNL